MEAIAAYSWRFNFLISTDGSESLEGMAVTPGYFRVMGLEPILGRVFSEAEPEPRRLRLSSWVTNYGSGNSTAIETSSAGKFVSAGGTRLPP